MFLLQTQNSGSSGLDSQSYAALMAMKGEQPPRVRHLGELLPMFRWFRATDPRDKVYGLMGLSSNPKLLRPNYTVSIEQCYLQATFSIINDTGSLDILEHCTAPNFISRRKLPSWVPDLSYDAQSLPSRHLVTETSLYLKLYQATMFKSSTSGPSFKASRSSNCAPRLKNGTTLVVDGILIDTIKDLKPPILLTHFGMRPCNGRGIVIPNPSASPQQQAAAIRHAAWLTLTSPILFLLHIINLYRIGKFLTIILSYWTLVYSQRNGAELVALKDVLSVLTNDSLDRNNYPPQPDT